MTRTSLAQHAAASVARADGRSSALILSVTHSGPAPQQQALTERLPSGEQHNRGFRIGSGSKLARSLS